MISLKGKNVIITGAGDGIGKAVAMAFAKAGANIALAGRTESKLRNVAREVCNENIDIFTVKVDVTEENGVRNMIKKTAERFGTIDIMINNAGICELSRIEDMSLEDWNKTMEIDLTGVFLCCREVIPQMKDQGYGKIINMASQAGKVGMEKLGHYCAAKAGVILLTRSLALELAKYHITVNSVCPGNVATDMMAREATTINEMTGQAIEDVVQQWTDCIPLGRYAKPAEIADLFLFLASNHSDYITGEDINITGGMTMH